jgi:hypothetical protein
MPSKNTWEKTDRLAEHLTYGEPTIEPISESEAKKALGGFVYKKLFLLNGWRWIF